MLQSGELCYFSIAPLILNVLNSPRLSSSASSATLRVLLGSWIWRLSRSPCGPTCQRTPWDPPWWRSASLQARERWLQAESLLLTRRKSGKMIVSIQNEFFFPLQNLPLSLTKLFLLASRQWDAGGLAGENHAGSRAGGFHAELLSHAAFSR